ncbi:hypothetical protein BU17DRAFT_64280 [Hysterangium stoloniferum]|nr:hypothetical protein BU17DRAFT_64280 [Hysterangium stoloniferum]
MSVLWQRECVHKGRARRDNGQREKIDLLSNKVTDEVEFHEQNMNSGENLYSKEAAFEGGMFPEGKVRREAAYRMVADERGMYQPALGARIVVLEPCVENGCRRRGGQNEGDVSVQQVGQGSEEERRAPVPDGGEEENEHTARPSQQRGAGISECPHNIMESITGTTGFYLGGHYAPVAVDHCQKVLQSPVKTVAHIKEFEV